MLLHRADVFDLEIARHGGQVTHRHRLKLGNVDGLRLFAGGQWAGGRRGAALGTFASVRAIIPIATVIAIPAIVPVAAIIASTISIATIAAIVSVAVHFAPGSGL